MSLTSVSRILGFQRQIIGAFSIQKEKTMENFDWESFVEESKKYKACAGIWIDKESDRIELLLNTAAATYSEWIPGEGADICLVRCHKSNKVIGVNLPLYQTDFSVFHSDGIRVKINEGFLKDE